MHPLTGGLGREYPALDPADRAGTIERNASNRPFCAGSLGGELAAHAGTTSMIQPRA